MENRILSQYGPEEGLVKIPSNEIPIIDFYPSEEECKEQCRKVRSFIKRYRARDEKISRLMLQPEWQEMRQYAFRSKTEDH